MKIEIFFVEVQDQFHNYTTVFGRFYYPVKILFFGISTPNHIILDHMEQAESKSGLEKSLFVSNRCVEKNKEVVKYYNVRFITESHPWPQDQVLKSSLFQNHTYLIPKLPVNNRQNAQ